MQFFSVIKPSLLDVIVKYVNSPRALYFRLAEEYGKDIAANVYRIIALETDHFKDSAWKKYYNAGMEAFSHSYPWGWEQPAIKNFWDKKVWRSPIGVVTLIEAGTGNKLKYLKFPGPAAQFYTIAEFLKNNGNNAGAWNSKEEGQRAIYENSLQSISLPRKS